MYPPMFPRTTKHPLCGCSGGVAPPGQPGGVTGSLVPARAGPARDGERGNSRASHQDLHVTSLPTKHHVLLEPHVRWFHPPVVGHIYGTGGPPVLPLMGERHPDRGGLTPRSGDPTLGRCRPASAAPTSSSSTSGTRTSTRSTRSSPA